MYAAIEAWVHDGVVTPVEATQLPKEGRVLIVLLPDVAPKALWAGCRKEAGWLKLAEDPAEWQRRARDEWRSRP